MPEAEIDVFERNKAGDTFGWGVVFSDQTLINLQENDPISAKAVADSIAHWDDIEVAVNGESMISGGHGFIGIGRRRLLRIFQARAAELGIRCHFEHEFNEDLAPWAGYDLIVASDGVNSAIRTANKDRFGVDIQHHSNRFTWLGTTKLIDAFGFYFEKTEAGWLWAHAYRFDDTHSTFIVECSPETWGAIGFEHMSPDESIATCERIFARHLDGHPLISNARHLCGSAAWIQFRRIHCDRWSFGNVVLLGDAAHTAHFSIGSGTKLGLEDAIKLAEVLADADVSDRSSTSAALEEYQRVRELEVLKLQNSARNSTDWFESLERYIDFDLRQFTYSLLTRSQRVSHENLRLRDKQWLEDIEKWFWLGAGGNANATGQPIFAPLNLGNLKLPNRIAVAPMLTYMANADGNLSDFHTVHYGARALGGVGLVYSEMLAVSPAGRMTDGCPGLYTDEQAAQWARINAFIHGYSPARTCAQLGHAGARAASKVPEDAGARDQPLDRPWPIYSASAQAWSDGGLVPIALDRAEMDNVVAQFVAATGRAEVAGFDMIEIQAGHGTLLSSFITPVMNARTDEFGGSLDNRLRFPIRVIEAVRAAWPTGKPISVRISATDWCGDRGIQAEDAVEIARRLKEVGVDIVDVSTGETSPSANPVYGRMYQAPFADQIRNEAKIRTIAVGNITNSDQANSIIAAGRADLVAIGRPHLVEPMWTTLAAATGHYQGLDLPVAYKTGWQQLTNLVDRAERMRA